METEVRLKRQLGLIHGVGIVAGLVIGGGIYISPRGVILHAGSAGLSLILWVVAGALSMFGALTFAEIGLVFPQSGALYVYTRTMYGRFAGFLCIWSYLFFVRVGANAVKCLVCGRYILKPFFPNCVVPDIGIKLVATTVGCKLSSFTLTFYVYLRHQERCKFLEKRTPRLSAVTLETFSANPVKDLQSNHENLVGIAQWRREFVTQSFVTFLRRVPHPTYTTMSV